MNSGMFGNPHQALLDTPLSDSASNARLLEEVKSRAKGAFSAGDMPNCELLYSKALTISEESTVYSNRSMVRLKLGKNEGALEDAEAAIKLDAASAKAHYRKVLALRRLGEFDRALDACKADHAKENKEIIAMVDEIVTDKVKAQAEKAALKAEAEDLSIQRDVPQPTRIPISMVSKAQSAPKRQGEDGSELRGYKKKEDGTVTSFFHMDISEEAKNLIGDTKPQMLEAPIEEKAAAGGGSVWNQGGTYESKSYSNWAKTRLTSLFPVSVPINELVCTCAVPTVENDLEIVVNRGKRRHVNDLTYKVGWAVHDKAEGELAKGTITLENEGDGDYYITVDVDVKSDPKVKPLVDTYIKASGSQVQSAVVQKVTELDSEFRCF